MRYTHYIEKRRDACCLVRRLQKNSLQNYLLLQWGQHMHPPITIRLPFDGHSTAYQRSLRSQLCKPLAAVTRTLFIYLGRSCSSPHTGRNVASRRMVVARSNCSRMILSGQWRVIFDISNRMLSNRSRIVVVTAALRTKTNQTNLTNVGVILSEGIPPRIYTE